MSAGKPSTSHALHFFGVKTALCISKIEISSSNSGTTSKFITSLSGKTLFRSAELYKLAKLFFHLFKTKS